MWFCWADGRGIARQVRRAVIDAGTEAILAFLRTRIPDVPAPAVVEPVLAADPEPPSLGGRPLDAKGARGPAGHGPGEERTGGEGSDAVGAELEECDARMRELEEQLARGGFSQVRLRPVLTHLSYGCVRCGR